MVKSATTNQADSNPKEDELYEKAKAEEGNYTLIPASKIKVNKTVEAVEPIIERDGMVVCKRK